MINFQATIEQIEEKTREHLGSLLIKEFPYATSGDVSPIAVGQLRSAIEGFASEWISNNAEPLYFSGDWCEQKGQWTAYEAVRFGETWNGWEAPFVNRIVASRIVTHQQRQAKLFPDTESRILAWHNDDIIVVENDGDQTYAEFIKPTEDGLYDVGLGWCWWRVQRDHGIDFRVYTSDGDIPTYRTT